MMNNSELEIRIGELERENEALKKELAKREKELLEDELAMRITKEGMRGKNILWVKNDGVTLFIGLMPRLGEIEITGWIDKEKYDTIKNETLKY